MHTKQQSAIVIYTQLAMIVLVSLLFFLLGEPRSAISVLLGGLAVLGPTVFFLAKVFSSKLSTPAQMTKAFYRGEAIKLILTALLVFLFVKFFQIEPLGFFAGFIGSLLVYWLILIKTAKQAMQGAQ